MNDETCKKQIELGDLVVARTDDGIVTGRVIGIANGFAVIIPESPVKARALLENCHRLEDVTP